MLLVIYGVAYMPNDEITKFVYGPYFNQTEAIKKVREVNIPSYKVIRMELTSIVDSWEVIE